ncbi:hypothetical protein I350_00339 [Cryptococcus amylolentus CBS 6273]|uniref:DH domain-containing protein n=1 Tax=Cryptococcus amylolentus CBS 6273 TaxID=1296118 RepID=A0A1E3KEP4_9TREE|nr:hypothetical protein I350_00339 [Cryptococcus amylolentus CBS 6273]
MERHLPARLPSWRRHRPRLSWSGRASPRDHDAAVETRSHDGIGGVPYSQQPESSPYQHAVPPPSVISVASQLQWRERRQSGGDEEMYVDDTVDEYSWIDPSEVGTDRLRTTPLPGAAPRELTPRGFAASSDTLASHFSTRVPSRNLPSPPNEEASRQPGPSRHLSPEDSYNLLLLYQSTSPAFSLVSSYSPFASLSPGLQQQLGHAPHFDPEFWYEVVDKAFHDSLDSKEQNRQESWWEMVRSEKMYVEDLGVICDVLIHGLRTADPPIIEHSRLEPFINEVFSTSVLLYQSHLKILSRVLERQREQWPLMMSLTDIYLENFLELLDLYDAYMKNYPYAKARAEREAARNPKFALFLTSSSIPRKGINTFLMRPATRLPRVILMLRALLHRTPLDHQDQEDIPTLIDVLHRVVKSSEPGISSAEEKIGLWDVAERLMFKKGEIVELDLLNPKRALVHRGDVRKRVRIEKDWHGWQKIHAILLDNYLLLTREDNEGRFAVVSRPIHLDFMRVLVADAVPERSFNKSNPARGPTGGFLDTVRGTDMMYPFTISDEDSQGRTYTICTEKPEERRKWIEKIEGAKVLRDYDVESNRLFVINTISPPRGLKDPVTCADTFVWHGNKALAVAAGRSVWIGWLGEADTFQEAIRFDTGQVTSITTIPEFPWLLTMNGGTIVAFNLRDMMTTVDPQTWVRQRRIDGVLLSRPGQHVAWMSVGKSKGRTLVAYAVYANTSHNTVFAFVEPFQPHPHLGTPSTRFPSQPPFRLLSTLTVPGYASSLTFFRATLAVITEKEITITEIGNPDLNTLPTTQGLGTLEEGAPLLKLLSGGLRRGGGRPLGMWQTGDNEFILVYDWGACYVTKCEFPSLAFMAWADWMSVVGEISRSGTYLRWNGQPSQAVFQSPYLLLFDEFGGRAEVRDVVSGRMCEIIEEKGLRLMKSTREDQTMCGWTATGLVQVVETVTL